MNSIPATRRQMWALFCATKKDYRNSNLSKDEAGKLLSELNDSRTVNLRITKKTSTLKITKKDDSEFISNFKDVLKLAENAADRCVPIPMVVNKHANQLDDNSPIVKTWKVDDGVCGFAFLNIKANTGENRKFINEMKRYGYISKTRNKSSLLSKDSYYGGYDIYPTIPTQSLERKLKYCETVNKFLDKHGISATLHSRMD